MKHAEKWHRNRLYFEDESPRIGCGWRTVECKAGYKWVYYIDAANGTKFRLPIKVATRILENSSKQLRNFSFSARSLREQKKRRRIHRSTTKGD